jgi:hypothetical protein
VAYREAIVSYLDVLGFRKLIQSSDTDPSKVDDITRIPEATKRKGGFNVGEHPVTDDRLCSPKTEALKRMIPRMTGGFQTV